jgi:hypothetical protein
MSTNNPDHDPKNSSGQPSQNGADEINFQLDIVDGEDPSRSVTDDGDEFNPYPPGPGPLPGTMRFVRNIDGTYGIIERGNFGGWIDAEQPINLDDVL